MFLNFNNYIVGKKSFETDGCAAYVRNAKEFEIKYQNEVAKRVNASVNKANREFILDSRYLAKFLEVNDLLPSDLNSKPIKFLVSDTAVVLIVDKDNYAAIMQMKPEVLTVTVDVESEE